MEYAPTLYMNENHIIVVCPYCFQKHKHGAKNLGTRSSHCGNGEYIIGNMNPITQVIQDFKKENSRSN